MASPFPVARLPVSGARQQPLRRFLLDMSLYSIHLDSSGGSEGFSLAQWAAAAAAAVAAGVAASVAVAVAVGVAACPFSASEVSIAGLLIPPVAGGDSVCGGVARAVARKPLEEVRGRSSAITASMETSITRCRQMAMQWTNLSEGRTKRCSMKSD